MSTDLQARLDRHTGRRGPEECWPWTGARTRGGYGHLKVAGLGFVRAPRLALHLALGLPLDGPWIARHACDRPECVNPAHLLAGTQRQNIDDMDARGRRRSWAKITPHQVRIVRARVEAGESSIEVARTVSVSYEQVRRIVTRKSWTWLD